MEIGGYIELERYSLPMLHEGAIALNCGRNALQYLIRANGIKEIYLPHYLCDSVWEACNGTSVKGYSVGRNFLPVLEDNGNIPVLIVNYYGLLDQMALTALKEKYGSIIIDNTQAYFSMPLDQTDTLYSCRKFFGVPDGAFLYTDAVLDQALETDLSYGRMNYLLGRYEKNASEFYQEYQESNKFFSSQPIKRMSKLTENLLHGIDYAAVKEKLSQNFETLNRAFKAYNGLTVPQVEGAFAYPLLLEHGEEVRQKLIAKKIYVPTLWNDALKRLAPNDTEVGFVKNLLPLPVDQRYGEDEMQYMINEVLSCLR